MRLQRKHAWVHILLSALIIMGLLAGCTKGVPQGFPDQQDNNQPGSTVSVSPIEPSPSATSGESSTDAKADSPAGILPETSPSPSNALEDKLEVHFIDVGQADAILIKQGSSAMVVDAGNNADSDFVVQYIKDQGLSKLDYVIGTHPHEDHIGGLDAVIKEFQVEKIIMPKVVATTKTYEDVLEAIQHKGLKVTTPVLETKYDLGYAEFTLLAPNCASYDSLNNYSVVIRLVYGDNSFLLTGDAEDVSEREMVDNGLKLKTDVLKVGHHGSSSSTTEEFLGAVDPRYAVICVGQDNSYGHPASSIIQRLQNRGIQIYRTDEKGTVIATSDGNVIQFSFDKGKRAAPSPGQTVDPWKAEEVKILYVDLRQEIVTLKNMSIEDIDLSGWVLHSVKGDQSFTFPKGCIIKAGSTLTIASGDAGGDIKWTNKNIWNNDGDPAQLIDAEGTVVSQF